MVIQPMRTREFIEVNKSKLAALIRDLPITLHGAGKDYHVRNEDMDTLIEKIKNLLDPTDSDPIKLSIDIAEGYPEGLSPIQLGEAFYTACKVQQINNRHIEKSIRVPFSDCYPYHIFEKAQLIRCLNRDIEKLTKTYNEGKPILSNVVQNEIAEQIGDLKLKRMKAKEEFLEMFYSWRDEQIIHAFIGLMKLHDS